MSSEALSCCGTTCDKSKLRGDQLRVVSAFDELDKRVAQFDHMRPDIDSMEKSFEQLRAAVACLRE